MEQDKPVLINDKDAAEFLQERITAQEQRVSAAMNELREAKAFKKALEKALREIKKVEGKATFPIVDNYAGKHDLELMEVIGDIYSNPELIER